MNPNERQQDQYWKFKGRCEGFQRRYKDSKTGINVEEVKIIAYDKNKDIITDTARSGAKRITTRFLTYQEDGNQSQEGFYYVVEKPLNKGTEQTITCIGNGWALINEVSPSERNENQIPEISVSYSSNKWRALTIKIKCKKSYKAMYEEGEGEGEAEEEADIKDYLMRLASIFVLDEEKTTSFINDLSKDEKEKVKKVIEDNPSIKTTLNQFASDALDQFSGKLTSEQSGKLIRYVIEESALDFQYTLEHLNELYEPSEYPNRIDKQEVMKRKLLNSLRDIVETYEKSIGSLEYYVRYEIDEDDPNSLVRKITTNKEDDYKNPDSWKEVHLIDRVISGEEKIFDGITIQVFLDNNKIKVSYRGKDGKTHTASWDQTIDKDFVTDLISDPHHANWQRVLELMPLAYTSTAS